jgi:hypothetical protein
MSDGYGQIFASAINAASQMIQAGIGTGTTTNGDTASNTHSVATVNVDDSTTTTTSGSTSTTNSVDPGVLAMLKQLAGTAISNSTDPSKTQGIITGFIQQAGDAISQIYGAQKQAGIYNSSSAASQSGDIVSRATADAASAILNYTTGQQNIAQNALQTLSQDTLNQVVNSNSSQTVNMKGVTTNTLDSSSTGTSHSKSSTSSSIVCTHLYNQGRISRQEYWDTTKDFLTYPQYLKEAYWMTASPVVVYMKKHPYSALTFIATKLFVARTKYLSGPKTLSGFLARYFIAACCIPAGLKYVFKQYMDMLVEEDYV